MSNQSVQHLVNKLILSLETQPRTWVRIQNSLAQLERDLRKSAGQDPWSEELDLYLLEQYRLALDLAEKEAAAREEFEWAHEFQQKRLEITAII